MDLKFLNPTWRRNNLYSIVNKDAEKVPLRRNRVQSLIQLEPSRRKMILKARQFGVSTSELIDGLDHTMWNKNVTCAILAHEQDAIEKLFRIVRRAYEFMDPAIKPELDRGGGSKYEMFFPDINSRIYCDLESRGDTIQRLHISEMAFMKNSARLKSTLQAVPKNGYVCIESTPNGIGNYFYDLWNDPEQDKLYKKMFFPWFVHSEYTMPVDGKMELTGEELALIKLAKAQYGVTITKGQIAFRRFKKLELKNYASDENMVPFEQEYPEDDATCFVSSGKMVFDGRTIKDMLADAGKPIRVVDGIKIYGEFDKTDTYVIGADVSEGVGGDFSTACVISVRLKKCVAAFRGQIRPVNFAEKLCEIANIFTRADGTAPLLAVERNNHGHAVILQLENHSIFRGNKGYPNLFVHEKKDGGDDRLGWKTTQLTRPSLLTTFVRAVEDRAYEFQDRATLEECLTLINNEGKLEAAPGRHDDCIIAGAIAVKIAIQQPDPDYYNNLKNRIKVG